MRALAVVIGLALASPAMSQSTAPKVYAAGSLRAALTDAAAAFKAQGGGEVAFEFGPSGLLRDRLAKSESADLFASANMEHPKALADAGKAQPVRMFAKNRLCALAPSRTNLSTAGLLDYMLDPAVKLGTSTPKADPSGDYAWQVFERAEKVKAGSFEKLSAKALQLVGGPTSPPPPPKGSAYAALVSSGKADVFLTYCTNAVQARKEMPELAVVELPPELSVGAEYGLATITDGGKAFAAFLLSAPGQKVLAAHGFAPPAP